MTQSVSNIAARAAELKFAFDRAFTEPQQFDAASGENLLGIRIAGQGCAIRMSEIAGLHVDKKIAAVPGGIAALRGIAGFRGAILPVYDLEILLGHAGTKPPRWLVIAAAAPVAFAFEAFERQLRVAREAVLPHTSPENTAKYTREFVSTENFAGPIMHLPSILDAIKNLEDRGDAKRGVIQT